MKSTLKKPKIIVTIPAYNEEKSIGKVISKIKKVMNTNSYNYKILVIDDGSSDSTVKEAKKAGAIVYSHPINYGLAETFRTEMKKCIEMNADIIVHTDADGQYLAEDIPELVKEVNNGYELVLGSRFMGHIEQMPLMKRIGNKAFSRVISKITKVKITDGQTGFRAFTKEAAKEINIISNHTYTQEQIIRAVKQKFRVKEVPAYFAKRADGKSRLMSNPFEYAFRAWINLLRIYRDYEPLKFFGYTGAVFFLTGLVFGGISVYNYFTEGNVGGLPKVMLSVLLISIGLQIWLFGFLADMNRK